MGFIPIFWTQGIRPSSCEIGPGHFGHGEKTRAKRPGQTTRPNDPAGRAARPGGHFSACARASPTAERTSGPKRQVSLVIAQAVSQSRLRHDHDSMATGSIPISARGLVGNTGSARGQAGVSARNSRAPRSRVVSRAWVLLGRRRDARVEGGDDAVTCELSLAPDPAPEKAAAARPSGHRNRRRRPEAITPALAPRVIIFAKTRRGPWHPAWPCHFRHRRCRTFTWTSLWSR